MKKYIPLKLRQHIRKPKSVKMPIRKVLKKDESEAAYYREVLMLMAQTATFQAEMLLDHEISIHERLLVQNTKNQLDKILDSVMGQLPEDYKDLHYDRMDFIVEMLKLATLIPPRYYEKMQSWMVERIESIHGIKGSKKMNWNRKYRLNKIGDCYVSSSSSPYLYIVVDVYSRDNESKGHLALSVQPDGEWQFAAAKSFERSFFDPPKYLVAEVKNAIKKHVFSFYEYDKHGNERREGLRYTDKHLISSRFLNYANN